jgi:hypothetical protein
VTDHARQERFPALVLDLVVAAVVFTVLGVVGAFVWHLVVDLPHYSRTAQGAQMDGLGLEDLFPINGWYSLIAAVLGTLGGAGLLLWRHREPVWMLLVSAASSLLAGLTMIQLGQALGPDNPGTVLRSAKVGTTAPVQLRLQGLAAHGHWYADPYLYAWLGGALLGTTLVLLFAAPRSGHGVDPAPVVSTAAGDVA